MKFILIITLALTFTAHAMEMEDDAVIKREMKDPEIRKIFEKIELKRESLKIRLEQLAENSTQEAERIKELTMELNNLDAGVRIMKSQLRMNRSLCNIAEMFSRQAVPLDDSIQVTIHDDITHDLTMVSDIQPISILEDDDCVVISITQENK